MGWRNDFKKVLIGELKNIPMIQHVSSSWKQDPKGHPALTVSLTTEEPERTEGTSEGPVTLGFEVMAKVKDIEDIENKLEELLDDVYEKIEIVGNREINGVITYPVIIDEVSFHEKTEIGEMGFTVSAHFVYVKDYSSM